MREINEAGLQLIKDSEGLRTKVYADTNGYLTVGYGHRTDLPLGTDISESQANAFLRADVATAEIGIAKYFFGIPLGDNEFAALVSFAYNCGVRRAVDAFLPALRNKFYAEAAMSFLNYTHDHSGNSLPGLVKRRMAERDLFLAPDVEHEKA